MAIARTHCKPRLECGQPVEAHDADERRELNRGRPSGDAGADDLQRRHAGRELAADSAVVAHQGRVDESSDECVAGLAAVLAAHPLSAVKDRLGAGSKGGLRIGEVEEVLAETR